MCQKLKNSKNYEKTTSSEICRTFQFWLLWAKIGLFKVSIELNNTFKSNIDQNIKKNGIFPAQNRELFVSFIPFCYGLSRTQFEHKSALYTPLPPSLSLFIAVPRKFSRETCVTI